MRKQKMETTVDHKPYAEMKTYAQEVGSTFVGMDASNPLKNYIRPILEMASWRGCARVAYCQEAATEGTPITQRYYTSQPTKYYKNLSISKRESFRVLSGISKNGCHFQFF